MIDRRASARQQAFFGAGVATLTAVLAFSMIAPGESEAEGLALLASGPATALYGALIFSARGGGLRTILGTIAIILIGLFHVGWLLALLAMVSSFATGSGIGGRSEWGVMFLLTGLGYSLVIPICTRSILSLVVLLPAAVVAGACGTTPGASGSGFGTALACSLLHASIATSLLLPTLGHIDRRWRPGLCRSCGYDLEGVIALRCPECGAMRGQSVRRADSSA